MTNKTIKLQTYDQLRRERDLLLLSQRSLLNKIKKIEKISKSRLNRLKKALKILNFYTNSYVQLLKKF